MSKKRVRRNKSRRKKRSNPSINLPIATMFNPNQCSPRKDKPVKSCLSNDLLVKIAKIINKIDSCDNINCSLPSNDLHHQICCEIKKISDCKNEACWTNITDIMEKLGRDEKEQFKSSFKPFMPEAWKKEPNKWLNTLDIDAVMEQYEDSFPTFKYWGASPIDFSKKTKNTCEVNDLCKVSLKEMLDDDYESFGAIFNTDTSDGPGEHWFSFYGDLKGVNRKGKPSLYYFDSVGTKEPQEIIDLVEKLQEQGKKLDHPLDVLYNDIRHQSGNNECGIYSLHFLTEMLKGIPFTKYVNTKKNDKQMERLRKVFFINNP